MKKRMHVTVMMDAACVPEGDPDFLGDSHADTTEYHVVHALRELGHNVDILGVRNELEPIVHSLSENRPDIVFNLTEQFRDDRRMDGNVAGILELMAIPYTGTGSLGLMTCRNKGLCKQLLHARRIRVPGFVVVPKGRRIHVPKTVRFPLVVKPNLEDGSDGISNASLVRNTDELHERARVVHERFNQAAIAEEYIDGRELYVGVLGNKRLHVLPPREIILPDASSGGPVLATQRVKWDEEYQKKWNIRFELSNLAPEIFANVVRVCKRAYRVLQIRDYGRMDIRITPDNQVVILEANPNPDIAYGEEVAESAAQAGIGYNDLIAGILRAAWRRKLENQ